MSRERQLSSPSVTPVVLPDQTFHSFQGLEILRFLNYMEFASLLISRHKNWEPFGQVLLLSWRLWQKWFSLKTMKLGKWRFWTRKTHSQFQSFKILGQTFLNCTKFVDWRISRLKNCEYVGPRHGRPFLEVSLELFLLSNWERGIPATCIQSSTSLLASLKLELNARAHKNNQLAEHSNRTSNPLCRLSSSPECRQI